MSPYTLTLTSIPLPEVISLDDLLLMFDRYSLILWSYVVFWNSLGSRVRLFLLAAVLLVAFICFLAFLSYFKTNKNRIIPVHTHSALTALSKIVIPTTSLWPSRYLSLVRSTHPRRIAIPLGLLVDEVLAGNIELRCPTEDLPFLLLGGVFVDGWEISLKVGYAEHFEMLKWVLRNWMSVSMRNLRGASHDRRLIQLKNISLPEQDIIFTVCSQYLGLTSSDKPLRAFHARILTTSAPSFTNVGTLNSYLSLVLGHFRRDHRHMAALLLTTSNLSSKTDGIAANKELALLSLPFIRRTSRPDDVFSFIPAAPTLVQVLSVLKSAASSLDHDTHSDSERSIRVHSVHNVSSQFVGLLTSHVERLEYDGKTRDECLRRVGVQGWREERLCSSWEAAAMKLGKVEKWVIVLEKF